MFRLHVEPSGLNESQLNRVKELEEIVPVALIGESCTICLEQFSRNHKIISLDCNHTFHSSCILRWYQDHVTCPVCREQLYGDENSNPQHHVEVSLEHFIMTASTCYITFIYPNDLRHQTMWNINHTIIDIFMYIIRSVTDPSLQLVLKIDNHVFKTTESFCALNRSLGSFGLTGNHEAQISLE